MKILLISDIHGNAEALRAVMRAEADADAAVFLGDALLSGPWGQKAAGYRACQPGTADVAIS